MIGRYDEAVARWGRPPEPISLSDRAIEFLTERVGPPRPTPQVPRTNIAIPEPRIDGDTLQVLQNALGKDTLAFDDDSRLAHSGGFSYLDLVDRRGEHPPVPDAVAFPSSHAAVVALLRVCSDRRIALIPFGGGTSVVGGLRPDVGDISAVISVSFERMADLLNIDDYDMTVTVQPGMTGPTLERLLKARGLTLGHFPQSWERASIGGYAATRSSGQASAGYGRSNEMIERLKVATPVGDFDLGRAPGSAAGPDLRQLFIGSEGILGIITEITLRIRRLPVDSRYEGVMFPSYEVGLDAIREMVARRATADVVRLSDPQETLTNLTMAVEGAKATALDRYLKLRKVSGGALAILGWEGSRTQIGSRRSETWRVLRGHGGVSLGAQVGRGWEKSRFSGPYLRDTLLDNGYLVETLETSTGWRELPVLRQAVTSAIRDALPSQGPGPWVMSHLSHIYETGGSLYVTVIAERDDADLVGQWKRAKIAACDALVANGATITHHHAVGRDHAPWMDAEIGDTGLDLLRSIKAHLDPQGILNPGVLIGEDTQ